MEIKDEGICRFCLQTFSGRSMGRHLTTCKVKKQKDRENAVGKKKITIYHLKLFSYKPFWLHIEMPAISRLYDLDNFLRRIWLECCDHLSEFTINEITYTNPVLEDELGGPVETNSMDVQLKDVLGLKDRFDYEYDFGSTTPVRGQVFAIYEGVLKGKFRILARNISPKFDCVECGAEAVRFCTDCQNSFCDACLIRHECGDELSLPIVNSPRIGVCSYRGENDFDNFSIKQ